MMPRFQVPACKAALALCVWESIWGTITTYRDSHGVSFIDFGLFDFATWKTDIAFESIGTPSFEKTLLRSQSSTVCRVMVEASHRTVTRQVDKVLWKILWKIRADVK